MFLVTSQKMFFDWNLNNTTAGNMSVKKYTNVSRYEQMSKFYRCQKEAWAAIEFLKMYFSRVIYVVVMIINLIKEIYEIFCKFYCNTFYLIFSEFSKKNDRLARDLYTFGIVGWAFQKHQKIAVRRRRITSYKPSPRSTPRKPLYTVLS